MTKTQLPSIKIQSSFNNFIQLFILSFNKYLWNADATTTRADSALVELKLTVMHMTQLSDHSLTDTLKEYSTRMS